jgi:hypothetical protein
LHIVSPLTPPWVTEGKITKWQVQVICASYDSN